MNNLNTIEGFLTDVCDFLKTKNFCLSSTSDDGRINSSLDEDIVLDLIVAHYGNLVQKMPPRSWCDFKHVPTNEPINFKSTSMKSSDNACNYLALIYALTDLSFEDERKPHSTNDKKQFLTWVRDTDIDSGYNNNRDYWFLIVNKNDPSTVFYNSIKQLNDITSNPSNPPFQVNWSKNKKRIARSFENSIGFINETVFKTIKKQYDNLGYDLMKEIIQNG